MKFRSIISCGLLLLGVGAATTSCQDMFTADNKLVTTDLTPQDTVYQMMGIVQRMQKLADRTVLLGEIRADLIDVNENVASSDIQDLHKNSISNDNAYNQPVDYYAVINNCNIYLAYVDSLLKTNTEYYYAKEICSVKCFRAWCYLELAKIYGNVPLVTEPVLTADAAEQIVSSGNKADMKTILDFCIKDLDSYKYSTDNYELRPTFSNGSQNWNGISYENVSIPVRALLAELYLWRGTYTQNESDFLSAAGMYHDFLCFPNEERGVFNSLTDYVTKNSSWEDEEHHMSSNGYTNRFMLSTHQKATVSESSTTIVGTTQLEEQVGVIPMDTVTYYGNVSDLRKVFNSEYANNYYPWVSPSQCVKDISSGQDYWYHEVVSSTTTKSKALSHDANDYQSSLEVGDLRLSSVYQTLSNISQSKYNSNYNDMKSFVAKWTGGVKQLSTDIKNPWVPYYRVPILYLHLAEALNRAGLPETAFVILSRGISAYTLNNYVSSYEVNKLCNIQSYGGAKLQESAYGDTWKAKSYGTFAVWPFDKFGVIDKTQIKSSKSNYTVYAGSTSCCVQTGIHSLGSGDTEFNENYYLDDSTTIAKYYELYQSVEVPDYPVLPKNASAQDSLTFQQDSVKYVQAYLQRSELVDNYIHSSEVTAKRQAHVAQLILDEEALEGMFEGYRFYDLMRYQMQEGKFNNKISLPSYIKANYQKSNAWDDQMTDKPWYLTLPSR